LSRADKPHPCAAAGKITRDDNFVITKIEAKSKVK
jgi:hypothetical protein